MKKYNFFRFIVLTVLVLPLVYGYFAIIPEMAKYLLDALLLAYIVYFRRVFRDVSGFPSLYIKYVFVVVIIGLCSVMIHQESVLHLIPEIRRLIIPLFLYYIFTDLFKSYPETSVRAHHLIVAIMLVQIPATILQTVLFQAFVKLGLFSGYRHYLDAATGTLGGAGHTYLGVIIPLMFIYFYDMRLFKYMIPFIIPLILINSGGGIVLFAIVFVAIGIYSLFNGTITQRAGIVVGIGVFLGLLFVFSQTSFFKTNFYSYTRSFLFYSENYIEGGRETFVGQEHKISRINGYKFLSKRMDRFDYEQLFGLGFEFKNNKVGGYALSFKNDINSILAERGFLGLLAYVLFMIAFLWYVFMMLQKKRHKQIFVKMLFFGSFFIAGIYNQTSRSFTVWMILLFYLVLLENKDQYQALAEHLNLRRTKTKAKKTIIQPHLSTRRYRTN